MTVCVQFDQCAVMRDGTVLKADVYRAESDKKVPVLLLRTPYGKHLISDQNGLIKAVPTAARGFIVVIQDVRGRFASEGEWRPFNECEDGEDTIEWASGLEGADGRVVMCGISYLALTQLAAASKAPPALRAIAPMMAPGHPFKNWLFRGGACEYGMMSMWALYTGLDRLKRRYHADSDALNQKLLGFRRALLGVDSDRSILPPTASPLVANQDLGTELRELLTRPLDPELPMARRLAAATDLGKINAPGFVIAGWYDFFLQGSLDVFRDMRRSEDVGVSNQSRLVVGPWSHVSAAATSFGGVDFGTLSSQIAVNGKTSIQDCYLSFFEEVLSDGSTHESAPVQIFVMGINQWREEQEWPLARTRLTPIYLSRKSDVKSRSGDATLSFEAGKKSSTDFDSFDYDPLNPVPARGGALLVSGEVAHPEWAAGPVDQRDIEMRDDVLVYTSAPIEVDLEVTGPVSAQIWASTSAADTDFVVRLIDVHPDGYARILTDGIIRARYRNCSETGGKGEPIIPNKIYRFDIDLWSTSNVFKAGHSIRIDITSSCFPRWDRNHNVLNDLDPPVVAHQRIYRNAAYPSHVLLPLVPPENGHTSVDKLRKS